MSKIYENTVLHSVLDFNCPFCGLPAHVFNDPVPAVAHDVPPCARFIELDVIEYLRACRLVELLGGAGLN